MLPLNCTISRLGSDAVGIVLAYQRLPIAVALNISSNPSEVLSTVCWGPARENCREKNIKKLNIILLVAGSAGDLPGKDVEGLGCCKTAAAIGEGHGDGVG